MGIPPVSELVIIGGIVLLLFGGKRLPGLGAAIGESIRNFRKGLEGSDDGSKKEETGAHIEKPGTDAHSQDQKSSQSKGP